MAKAVEPNQVASFLWFATTIVLAAAALVGAVGVFWRAAKWMIP